MNIKEDIQACLDRNGWTASDLARAAKITPAMICRVLNGTRAGLNSATISKLWPFLYAKDQRKTETAYTERVEEI